MGSVYTRVSVSGYNSNPPADDGSQTATNKITWAGIKTKLGDPLNTYATSQDSNVNTAFGKLLDGAGTATTAVDYPAGASDQGRLIIVTVSGKTVTTPDAGTVGSPFVFAVLNRSGGTITIAGNATNSQTIDGATSQVIKDGSGAIIQTDGTNWFTFGLKTAQLTSTNPPYAAGAAINLRLNASVGSSKLTIAVKTNSNNDPTTSDPVLIPFRDSTIANGDPVWVAVTSALSMDTNAAGATLGTQNNVPFRLWVVAFNNAGTAVLALWHSGAGASSFGINPLNETALQSTTGISAAATSAGTFYTPNGTSLSSKAFTILGWLEYASGLATAGTYGIAPTTVQLFGPGCKKPGDVVQTIYQTTTTTTAASSTAKQATALTGSITVTSNANPVEVVADGEVSGGATGQQGGMVTLWRNTAAVQVGNTSMSIFGATSGAGNMSTHNYVLDAPASSNWPPTQYGVYIGLNAGTTTMTFLGTANSVGTQTGIISIKEIMG